MVYFYQSTFTCVTFVVFIYIVQLPRTSVLDSPDAPDEQNTGSIHIHKHIHPRLGQKTFVLSSNRIMASQV